MRKKLFGFCLILSVFLLLLITRVFAISIITTPENETSGVYTHVPVYSQPDQYQDSQDEQISPYELTNGSTVEVIDAIKNNEFYAVSTFNAYKVKLPSGKEGYIRVHSLEDNYANQLEKVVLLALAKENTKGLRRIDLSPKNCPLQVVDYLITYNSIDIPEVNLKYLNKSSKTIKAFSALIYCYDIYGEPTSSFGDNVFRAGVSDEKLRPDDVGAATWTLNLFDNTRKVKVKFFRVLFSDETKWVAK